MLISAFCNTFDNADINIFNLIISLVIVRYRQHLGPDNVEYLSINEYQKIGNRREIDTRAIDEYAINAHFNDTATRGRNCLDKEQRASIQ